ncbi:MAG TPA: hypothetical protein VLC79_15630 [Cellvibrio sp.]|nr:hypothetical protein [Cellvibrio sp.]
MSSGVKFALYTLAAILFIGGLNSLVNGEKATEFILWLIPFLCLGTGIGIPVLILVYEAYFSNDALNSDDDNTISANEEENSNTDKAD